MKLDAEKEIKLPAGVLDLAAAPDGASLYVACMDGSVRQVEVASGSHKMLGSHESYASGLALLPGKGLLVSGGYDGALRWHSVGEAKEIASVQAHQFWSWQMAASPDEGSIASVTGQYLAGGYKYEPQPEREPSVRLYHAATRAWVRDLAHVPPVMSVAFSRNSEWVAAGNLMGEVRVWEVATGKQVAQWTTGSFTGWGIIKGHYYTGGIYALEFAAADAELYCIGMGSTTDPAAGNGRQLWQRFDWRTGKLLAETKESESGKGLMETCAFHPGGANFVMAGRLENGKWTTALFDVATGAIGQTIDTKSRVTRAQFSADGTRLFLGETLGQSKPKEGKAPDYGRISIFKVT